MPSGIITGKTNIPTKYIGYEGIETDTAYTTVNNEDKTIQVKVKSMAVTEEVREELSNHINDKNNPHEVTKSQVGLGNVDNTSDLDKPISTVTQSALDLKADKIGPLPYYELGSATLLLNFITENSLNNKSVIIMYQGSSYLCCFNPRGPALYSFEIESIGGKTRYAGVCDFTDVHLYDVINSTYEEIYEIENNKVSSLSSSSTDTEYPSAKCVYDQLELKADKIGPLPFYSVSNETKIIDFLNENNLGNHKPFALFYSGNYYICGFKNLWNTYYEFELEQVGSKIRYYGSSIDLTDATFGTILSVNTYRSEYEITTNKVTSIDSSSTNAQYPSAKCVYDGLQNVREVAEGKCKTICISYNTTFTQIKDYLIAIGQTSGEVFLYNDTTGEFDIDITLAVSLGDYDSYDALNGYFNDQSASISIGSYLSDYLIFNEHGVFKIIIGNHIVDFLHKGDIVLVYETDVPDRWYDVDSFYKLETSKVDLTNYYAKNESLVPSANNTYDLGSSSYAWKDLYLSDAIKFAEYTRIAKDSYNRIAFYDNSDALRLLIGNPIQVRTNLVPYTNNSYDLGVVNSTWKDLYLSGVAYIGTYSSITESGGNLILTYDGNNVLYVSNSYIQANRDLIPVTNNARSLGSSSYKWKDLYLSGNLTNTGTRSVDGLCGKTGTPTVSSNSVELPYDTISTLSLNANTSITLQTNPTGCTPEYRAKITNSGSGAINLTFASGTLIKTNDEDNVLISSNVAQLTSGISVELSIVDGCAVIVNFGAN